MNFLLFCLLDGANRCETAYLTLKCFFEKAPEVSEYLREHRESTQFIESKFSFRVPNCHRLNKRSQ